MVGVQFDVVIVGAGHAGAHTAVTLRQQKFEGSVAIVGDEPEYPYERPPLSKEYLSGEKSFDRIQIRPPSFWHERRNATLLGQRVSHVDPVAQLVTREDGEQVGYGVLVWAAGGRAKRLICVGADLEGVHVIRSRADVDGLVSDLQDAQRVAVIGGGFIGLEAAAVLTKLGKSVVVLEAQDRVLARVAGEPVSRFYEAYHRSHGVELRTGVAVERLEGDRGRVVAVRLKGGEVLPVDVVIVGIGIAPCVEPLIEAGARGGDGVEVDDTCRTSLQAVYAIGDCAAHINRFANFARIRLESVQNANDQAAVAVAAIRGAPRAYSATPWFWSNQYDIKLQTVGLSTGHDECVVRGDPANNAFSVVYLRDGHVIALDCINATKDFVQGRKLVESRLVADPQVLADPQFELKALTEAVA